MKLNVLHNKISYAKDAEIQASDENFKELFDAGFVQELVFADEAGPEAEPEQPVKSAKKSTK